MGMEKPAIDAIVDGLVEHFGNNEGSNLDIYCVKLSEPLEARLRTIEAQNDRIIGFITQLEEMASGIPALVEELKAHPVFGSLLSGIEFAER